MAPLGKRLHSDTEKDHESDWSEPTATPPSSPLTAPPLPIAVTKRQRLRSPQDLSVSDWQYGSSHRPLWITIERVKTDGLDATQLAMNRRTATETNSLDTLTTVGGESFIRTFHPAFEEREYVGMLVLPSGWRAWIVEDPFSAPTTPVAGLLVHLMPQTVQPYYPPSKYNDPFDKALDPRQICSDAVLSRLLELFSYAIGFTVFKAGVLNVMVPTGKGRKLLESLQHWPGSLGGLIVGLQELELRPTVQQVNWGTGAAATAGAISMGAVGLKLRIGGKVALTVATHCFVDPALTLTTKNNIQELSKRMAIKVVMSRPVAALCKTKPVAWCLKKFSDNSALGKLVYLGSSKEPVGRITETFDKPSTVIPYPHGYRHDLSLVTQEGKPLPDITPPVNGPRLLPEFAHPAVALAGSPVFTLAYEASSPNTPKPITGHVISDLQKNELVEGVQYLWQEGQWQRSLLWRTEKDYETVQGTSGSVLCVGSPDRMEPVQAVLFQNYETPFPFPWALKYTEPQPLDHYRDTLERPPGPLKTVSPTLFCLKGGFFLPEEIQKATIIAARVGN
ncbi:hypothetical protein BJ508DRAFT_327948 [Ascobolus immersus RN42]|uniref:Uncharacterized protein n=1 Tax=Ascobolus immersus RN42 TaxID=1160509 RepID=A0A3N4I3C3_ASCIM|nr:hypothetical protein BJ508DRAFT_327948 [Ascobolus immersus RN42]